MLFPNAVRDRLNRSDPVRSLTYGVGLGTLMQSMEESLSNEIAGTWYYVDPTDGDNSADGLTKATALKDIQTAYGKCVSGAGDGIRIYSRGITSAGTTSYIDIPLTWSKHGITVIGIAAPTMMSGRARISNKVRTTGAITTIAFSADTISITDSAEGFITAGFKVGMLIEIDTTSNTNDGQEIITAVTAGTITCSGATFTEETAVTAGSTTIASYITHLIEVSGNNNTFINLHMASYDPNVLAVGSLLLSGNRNAFIQLHVVGAAHATPAAATGAYDLRLNGANENTFYGCVFGANQIPRTAANGNILYGAAGSQNKFIDCEIYCQSNTAGKGAIKTEGATSLNGMEVYTRCRFIAWKPNGAPSLTSAFIGTKPNSGYFLMDACSLFGWAAWDSVAGNDTVYVANSAAVAAGAGGIATSV